jgi:hypothetical protein
MKEIIIGLIAFAIFIGFIFAFFYKEKIHVRFIGWAIIVTFIFFMIFYVTGKIGNTNMGIGIIVSVAVLLLIFLAANTKLSAGSGKDLPDDEWRTNKNRRFGGWFIILALLAIGILAILRIIK